MTSLPPISSLPHSTDSQLANVLDVLFEPSPPLHSLTLPVLRSTTFPSYGTLIVAVNAQLSALAGSDKPQHVATLSEILCSHPRLGEKKVDSEQSRKEQAQLQSGGDEEKEKLASLNKEYEDKFPGLRYVYVCSLCRRYRCITCSLVLQTTTFTSAIPIMFLTCLSPSGQTNSMLNLH